MIHLVGVLVAVLAAQDDWPTLHKDLQRSGYTEETLSGPFERKWYRDFHDEMIASRVEAIVSEDHCFVGTFAGNLHALRIADGKTDWTFKTGGPIGHSPAIAGRQLFVGSDDGFLYCLTEQGGALMWKYPAGAGVWVAPTVVEQLVVFGDRAGVVHGVRTNGKPAWTFKTGGMILKPASVAEDRSIIVASEDMHVYCLTIGGRLLWKSKKLQGLSTRDEAPTIWKGMVLVRTSPADGFHEVMNRNQNLLGSVQKELPVGEKDKFIGDQYATLFRFTPERHRVEQEAVLKYLRENPADQTFYALKLEDGSEPWIAPIFYTCGLHNPATAPTFNPKTGECYTYYRTALTNFSRGVRPYTGVGRLDPVTGLVENLWHAQGDQPGWSDFATIGDETQSLSLMGEILISTHQGTLGGLHPVSRKWFPIVNRRDTYGGIFGPGALPGGWEGEKKFQRDGYLVNMCNEWHGPDRGIVAIASRRMFWVVGSQVVCVAGPDIAKTDTGGTQVPPPWKKKFDFVVTAGGNLTADRVGGFDDKVERLTITPDQLRPFLAFPSTVGENNQDQISNAVGEFIRGMWKPFVVELGISKEERHFTQPSEALQILALAAPYLTPQLKAEASAYMATLFDAGLPPGRTRRELYDLGPGMTKFAEQPLQEAPIDAYAAATYAQATGAWDKVLAREAGFKKAFDALKPAKIDPKAKDAGAQANRQIAVVLGYARIAQKANKADEVDRALAVLAELVTDRVHHERADSNFVREVRGAHSGSIPRYHDLVPELAGMLHAFCPKELERNVRALDQQLPLWYQAFAERMAGGENYTHTPLIARGMFAILADGVQAPSKELAAKLDQPWCRADLYFIEKLAAIARAGGR